MNDELLKGDPLYSKAVECVTHTRCASISRVQMELRIERDYAARLIEAMESNGIVGPLDINNKREILTTKPINSNYIYYEHIRYSSSDYYGSRLRKLTRLTT